MKKSALLFILAFLLCPHTASATAGDAAGRYYSTDICAILNGAEVASINIGGQTLISAEDMQYYSFNVCWSGEHRTLDIFSTPVAANGAPPAVKKSAYPTGTALGDYYETDIVTSLDGSRITAYNTGGRTYILAEQMTEMGYSVEWNEADRVLSVTSPDRAGYSYSIFLSRGEEQSEESVGAFSIAYDNGGITGSGDANYFNSSLRCDGKGYTLSTAFYQNEGLFSSTELRRLIHSLASSGNIENPCDASEKYTLLISSSLNMGISRTEKRKST